MGMASPRDSSLIGFPNSFEGIHHIQGRVEVFLGTATLWLINEPWSPTHATHKLMLTWLARRKEKLTLVLLGCSDKAKGW